MATGATGERGVLTRVGTPLAFLAAEYLGNSGPAALELRLAARQVEHVAWLARSN
jgi:hypothetical protein